MKRLFTTLLCAASSTALMAQISITATDMPVSGDTLRYSMASPVGSTINLTTTGANTTWDFTALTPLSQSVDAYKTALQVNPLYAATISVSAYGYKVADSLGNSGISLPISLPISITDIYTFFNKKNSPSRFIAEAFAANVSGLPTAANYSDEDEWYFFPLNYNNHDSSTFKLSYSMAGLGSFSQQGKRITDVDGWGTIKTPQFPTGVSCLRVRSVVTEIDSISFSGTAFGMPRKTVDYKWLANGEHYPILWVSANVTGNTETITSIRYRDQYRPITTNIATAPQALSILTAYPNPAQGDNMNIALPSDWTNYTIEVFDINGKLLLQQQNRDHFTIQGWSHGNYLVRVSGEKGLGFAQFIK